MICHNWTNFINSRTEQITTAGSEEDRAILGQNSGHAPQHRWTVLVRVEVKCNVDAAIFKDKNCFSADMCVRIERGEFICAQMSWKKRQQKPQEVEASRLRQDLLWLMN